MRKHDLGEGFAARVRMGRLDDDDPQLVSACVAAGDDNRARGLLTRWSERRGVDDETRLRLAWEALCAGAYPLVLRLLAPLVDTDHPEALALIGESMVLAGAPLEGAERLRRATELDPSLARAWDFLGVVMAKRKAWGEAELPLRRAAELGPEGPERHRNLAMLLLDAGRGAEAVAPAERAVAMLEVDDSSLGLLARAYQAAGDGAWATLAAWAADYYTEQHLHRAALGGVAGALPGNVPPPPDLFRPSFGRFKRRLEEIAAGL
ncbi:MAG: hypothetical protein R3B09_00330 [Nannocystaceae bacterium]